VVAVEGPLEIHLEAVGPHRYARALEKGQPTLSAAEEVVSTSCCGWFALPYVGVHRPFLGALEWALRQTLAVCTAAGLACQVSAISAIVGSSICFLAGVNAVVSSRTTMTGSLQACFYGAWLVVTCVRVCVGVGVGVGVSRFII
jgi:hypothetical protein